MVLFQFLHWPSDVYRINPQLFSMAFEASTICLGGTDWKTILILMRSQRTAPPTVLLKQRKSCPLAGPPHKGVFVKFYPFGHIPSTHSIHQEKTLHPPRACWRVICSVTSSPEKSCSSVVQENASHSKKLINRNHFHTNKCKKKLDSMLLMPPFQTPYLLVFLPQLDCPRA